MGVRMSGLPLAAYCGRSAGLDTGAGRAAAMSTAWHSWCDAKAGTDPAKPQRAEALLALLSEEEREQVKSWGYPDDVMATDGSFLRYPESERELEVGLNAYGEYVPNGHADLESLGHLDFAWAIDGVAYVGDLKKTEFTATDSVESLQLIAYGFAYASLRKCHSFCCGIWAATEGRWTWGNIIELDSPEALTLWKRCLAAIRNVGGEFSRGPHCRGCYSRFQCPAHMLSTESATATLAVLQGGELTGEQVAQAVLDAAAWEDAAKTVKELAKAWETQHPGTVVSGTKVWRPLPRKGAMGLDKEGLLQKYPDAKEFWRPGRGTSAYQWVNVK